MEVQKWVGISRRVWAVLIPVATLLGQQFGLDLGVYVPLLEGIGAGLAAAVSAGLMIWSIGWPDNANLKLDPRATPDA